MSDVRGEFEKWYGKPKHTYVRHGDGYFDDVVNDAWVMWQACAQRYEAQVNALLAIVEKQQEALMIALGHIEMYSLHISHQSDYAKLRPALAITPENVRLVALDGKYFNDGQSYVKIDAQYENSTDAVKLYTIKAQP